MRSWTIDNLNEKHHAEARKYLEEHFATSMFLLGNLLQYGAKLTTEPNSGNYKVLLRNNTVAGVFCMTRRGNLLLCLDPTFNHFDLLWNEAQKDGINFQGVLGDWAMVDPFWKYLEGHSLIQSTSIKSKEILYELSQLPQMTDSNTRRLGLKDFSDWLWLYRAFTKETGLSQQLSEEQLHAAFENFAEKGKYWGLFEDGKLVSTATLTTMANDIGQVGGVYTVPSYRNRGLSKRCVGHLIAEAARIFSLNKMILFTDEKNFSAQKVYESLGFQRLGFYGIYFQ